MRVFIIDEIINEMKSNGASVGEYQYHIDAPIQRNKKMKRQRKRQRKIPTQSRYSAMW